MHVIRYVATPFARRPGTQRQHLLLLLLTTSLLLSACGGIWSDDTSSSPDSDSVELDQSLPLDQLPDGLGRGYAQVVQTPETSSAFPKAGEIAPDFRFALDDGRYLTLSDLRGRPILINFWATWCGPCRLEMPDIVDAYNADNDLVVLAVNVQEDLDKVVPFAEEFAMTMPIVLDSQGELRKQYALRGMPTSIFVDRDGKVSTVWSGLLTGAQFDEKLAEIL